MSSHMTERPPKKILPRDPIARALFAWKAAMAGLTVVTSLFSYLAALAAASPACAGMDMLVGYLSGLTDPLARPLLSFDLLAGLMLRGTTARARDMITSNALGLFLFYPVPPPLRRVLSAYVGNIRRALKPHLPCRSDRPS